MFCRQLLQKKIFNRCPASSIYFDVFECRKFYILGHVCMLSSVAHESKLSPTLKLKPEEFATSLQKNQIQRCMLWFDKSIGKISHESLSEIADYLSGKICEGYKHEAIFFELGKRTNILLSAFVSNTTRGQGHGGIKLWPYNSMQNLLNDGLRFSQLNTTKASLANLWLGGAQGIIAEPSEKKHLNPDIRQQMCYDFGDFLTGLNGCFGNVRSAVGFSDEGLSVHDINQMHSRTRYVTGLTDDIGGLGNPSEIVGKGIVCVIESVLDFLGMGEVEGKTVAVQGAGGVGSVIIADLLDRKVGHIYVTDCIQKNIDDLQDFLREKSAGRLETKKVPFGDSTILTRECHVLVPCALGNLITKATLSVTNAKIICGPAYKQISDDVSTELFAKNGITFISSEIANRMTLVHQYVEAQGRLKDDPSINQHFNKDWEHSIFATMKKILKKSKEEKINLEQAAKLIADKMAIPNPLWQHRHHQIISCLVQEEWYKNQDFWRRRINF